VGGKIDEMEKEIQFLFCALQDGREMILDSLNQANQQFEMSIRNRNTTGQNYWLERVIHFKNELDWIEQEINKKSAQTEYLG
jgi:hypothetical protein